MYNLCAKKYITTCAIFILFYVKCLINSIYIILELHCRIMASYGICNINGLPRMTQQTHISHGMRFMADNIVKKI